MSAGAAASADPNPNAAANPRRVSGIRRELVLAWQHLLLRLCVMPQPDLPVPLRRRRQLLRLPFLLLEPLYVLLALQYGPA